MQNIITSLQYQTKRDNVTYYAIFAAVLGYILVFSDFNGFEKVLSLSGSEFFIEAQGLFNLPISIFLVILATRICGWDYTDKTMNYEILIGHSRRDVFFSRIWVSFIWCIPISLAIFILPPLVLTLMNGWGIYTDMGDMILRCVISVFAIFRMYCECVLLTFLTKSCYIGLIASYLLIEIGAVITVGFKELGGIALGNLTALSSMANFTELMTLDKYSFQYINGKDEMLFNAAVDPSYAAVTVIVSLLAGLGCIVVSYLYFRKSDMK